jgi:antitoxin component YwqK of YwqJK toxin-antitoxin module
MRYLLVVVLFLSVSAHAQWKDYMIGVKGDTLNRVDMKGRKQGPWVIHVAELRGERGYEEEGNFLDGEKEGPWRRYSLDGDLIALENYRWGQKDGKCVYFTYAGEPEHEESWRAINPQNPYDTVAIYDVNDPNKVVGMQVVKMDILAVKNGTWRFYDPSSGIVQKEEEWVMDKLRGKGDNATDDLAPIGVSNGTTSTEKKPVAKPKEVLEFEKKNSGKKKIKVRDGSTGG